MMKIHMLLFAAIAALVIACAPERAGDEVGVTVAALEVGTPLQYRPFPFAAPVPVAELDDLPTDDPSALGGAVISGDPRIYARVDDVSPDGRRTAGVFEVSGFGAVLDVFYPFDEHAQFTHGWCAIRGEDGVTHFYGPGDAYFIRAGSVVRVTLFSERVQKSFY
jgi:uncharacterized cupin superfamily protein